jgi:hypothetical protein
MTTRSWRAGSAARHRHVQGAAPRVLFLGLNYAGHRTRFANLQAHTTDDPRIRPSYRCVTGWKPVPQRAVWQSSCPFMPWSRRAAAGLRSQRFGEVRIRALPPGVDLDAWRECPERGVASQQRLKLLLIGGDFDRKGGQILLDVFRDRGSDRCDLDVVTCDTVPPVAGASVHRVEADRRRATSARAGGARP